MVRDACRDGKQYMKLAELTSAIAIIWQTINDVLIQKLVLSIPKRSIAVLQKYSGKMSF